MSCKLRKLCQLILFKPLVQRVEEHEGVVGTLVRELVVVEYTAGGTAVVGRCREVAEGVLAP